MKSLLSFVAGIMILLISCKHQPSFDELKRFAATEIYPEDTYLDNVSNKTALIIVAHDDDDCAMSGTVSKLTAEGWTIKQLSLVAHPNKIGKYSADIICAGNEIIVKDGIYRMGLDTIKNPYMPIPYNEIKEQFLTEKVADALIERINKHQPSVIFTLDNIKGGYGHPEHVFISQLVLDLFQTEKIHVQRIYQSVYTNHMEKEIVDTWLKANLEKWGYPSSSEIANKLYGIDGMPEPDVQINIDKYAETKMKYLRAYPDNVRKNLRKFIPYYESFDAKPYFSLFNKEYFRIIEKNN
jgi:LmbE family N-acetylglucosaminyl deacetylase